MHEGCLDLQAGLKPVCEFMTFNFSMQAIDQVGTAQVMMALGELVEIRFNS